MAVVRPVTKWGSRGSRDPLHSTTEHNIYWHVVNMVIYLRDLRHSDLQLHQDAFGGRVTPGPTGELTALLQTPSWILGAGTGKGGEGKGGVEGKG